MTIQPIREATSIDELLSAYDDLLKAPASDQPSKEPLKFGVDKISGVSIERTRKEANNNALDILSKYRADPDSITDEDRAKLAQYTGQGGIGGSIFEYYTPDYVATGAWDALKAMGFENGNVCEPSAGAGVFNATKPAGVRMTATEISETSAAINQILHPEDMVLNQNFEKLATNVEDNHFDAIIGNVPFGDTRGRYGKDDPEYKHIKNIELYFFLRALDKVKHGGLVALVAPTNIVDRKSFAKHRRTMALKGEFMGAHRMPTGTFGNSGSDSVVTDLVLFRKHSEDATAKIADMSDEDLSASNVLWDTFIDGKWFDQDGKRFIQGEVSSTGEGQFKRMVVKNGALSNKAITEKLAHRFDSRINWELIDSAEPVVGNYAEGDQRQMNGRWFELKDGEWDLINFAGDDGDTLNPEQFGAGSLTELAGLLSDDYGSLDLDYSQLIETKGAFDYLISGPTEKALNLSLSAPEEHREIAFRGTMIGLKIQDLLAIAESGGDSPELRSQIKGLVDDAITDFGPLSSHKKLFALAGEGSGALNQFLTAKTADGDFTPLLEGTQRRNDVQAWDNTDPVQLVTFLFTQMDLHPVSLEDFNKSYTGEDGPLSLSDLAKMDGVAITPDGLLEPFDRFCSGDTKGKLDALLVAIAGEQDGEIANKMQLQYDAIQKKRKKTPIDSISISMRSKWMDRKYALEFLKETGYGQFEYGSAVEDEFGELYIDKSTSNLTGEFTGYRYDANGKKLNKADQSFERQLENFLNGVRVNGGKQENTAGHNDRIKLLEDEFSTWIRQHDDIDQIVDGYNDKFNGYIGFEHSDAPLQLTGIAEAVRHYTYQNSGIRRLSEEGRGILAFGTGLGKTFTALGVAAYDTQMGRARRIGIIVPKSVIENWHHESKQFFGEFHGKRILVPAVKVETDKDGNPLQEPWLDTEGKQRINEHTGLPEFRDKVKILSTKEINERMNMIPQSSYEVVIMTKEQFKAIPMRPENKEQYIDDMVDRKLLSAKDGLSALAGGKMSLGKETYKSAKKKERFQEKYSQETTKKHAYPYFEDMGFDRIIVDEGHNYRNSYAAGRETSNLAYLPTSGTADQSTDMAIKTSYIKAKNDGRGVMLLTATPTVNSPTDIFNMLSLVIAPDEWARYGITDVDDFISVFGETETVNVQKLSGAIESKLGLVGFKNLDGLRSLFHSLVNMKNAKDVSASVKLPDLEEEETLVDLTEEQHEIYEELRQQADSSEREKLDEADRVPIFSIIRDMDRVTTDMDLYNHTMTFHFPIAEQAKVEKLIIDLPETKKVKIEDEEKQDDESKKEAVTVVVGPDPETKVDGKTFVLVVNENFENDVINRLAKFKISADKVSHPLPPKYARLIENLKEHHRAGGKQLIFTEEKSQHNKIKRLISFHLGIKASEIGVINADTTSKDESLDDISEAYNTGKYRIVIANKKAEVGVNLHHGTTAMHHLTLPWTPASINQRNGRGRRVGSKQDKVKAYYYLGKGSFDSFRLETLKRKAGWMEELFNGTAATAKNADAGAEEDMQLLLAKDPEDLKRRREAALKAQEAKIMEAAKRRASIDLHNYLKAKHVLALAPEDREGLESELNGKLKEAEKALTKANSDFEATVTWHNSEGDRQLKRALLNAEEIRDKANKAVRGIGKRYRNRDKAINTVSQLRSKVASDIDKGTVNADLSILDRGDQSVIAKDGSIYTIGEQYKFKHVERTGRGRSADTRSEVVICHIKSLDFEAKTLTIEPVFVNSQGWGSVYKVGVEETISLQNLPAKWSLSNFSGDEIKVFEIIEKPLDWSKFSEVKNIITKDVFYKQLKLGRITISDGYAVRKDGKISFASKYGSTEGMLELALYPEIDNAPFREELARACLTLRKDGVALSSYSSGFSEPYVRYVLGNDWLTVIESYGKTASIATITKAIESNYQAWLLTDEAKEGIAEVLGTNETEPKPHSAYSPAMDWGWQAKAEALAEGLGDNINDFKALIDTKKDAISTNLRKQAKAEQETRKRRVEAEAEAERLEEERLVKLAEAEKEARIDEMKSEPAETRKARLDWLLSATKTFDSANEFALSVKNNEVDNNPYLKDGTANEEVLEFDLKLHFEGNDDVNTDRVRQMLMSLWREANGKDTAVFDGDNEGVFGPYTLRKNSTVITLGDYGRRRGRTFDQFARLGLFDSKGKSGNLKAAKEELKAAFGSGEVHFKTDASSEFEGAWWFIPATADLNQIKKILGVDDE